MNNLGRYSEALDAYYKLIKLLIYFIAIQLNPNFVEAWNNKGSALDNLGRYSEALDAYYKLIKLLIYFI